MITELLAWSGKFVVAASGVGGYGGCDRIVTKKVHDNFYIVGDTISAVDDRVKPYCPCVAAAAAKQADLVLQWTVSRKW
jgi:sulfur carrier protein ThiS adenylyltransferase